MKNKKYKAKKMAGLIVGLSLAQAGGIILPGMDVLSVVQAAEQEVSSEELAQAVAETLAELDATVDKSVLNDLISQAQGLDVSGSDDTAVAQLQKVIASAVQVSNNENARQSAVDRHIQLLQAAAAALYGKTEENVVYDGTYQISGNLMHASADQGSMGNAALVKPFQLIKNGANLYLRIECVPLTTKLGKQDFTISGRILLLSGMDRRDQSARWSFHSESSGRTGSGDSRGRSSRENRRRGGLSRFFR